MSMDISSTIEVDSSQLNADDLIGSPRTVTITGVNKGAADQPVNIELAEFPGRAYRPCKSMRRVLVLAWGSDASAYVGRRLTLFNDPSVKWAGQSVGGIRIAAMSHIQSRITVSLTVTRGKRSPFTVDPLPDEAPEIARTDEAEWPGAITKPQLQKLSMLRQRDGYADTDEGRADWFRMVQTTIGRLISTNKDLTKAEGSVLIDVLETTEATDE
jgi:hypothetical protein